MFVVAQFGQRTHPARHQPEREFHLVSEGRLPMHLPVHPELLPRPSPLADTLSPTAANDTAPASPPFASSDGTLIPTPRWTKWNVAHVAKITELFPYPELRSMALGS